jgi:hypothetical protein
MLNIFKKKQKDSDPNQMGFLQRLAMKKIERMSPEEKEKMAQKMLTPENIAKNKDKILESMEMMKASGQITDAQIEEAKKRLGL